MIEKPSGIISSTLSSLAKILSVKDDQIEDALASEKLVRRQLSRRGLFLGCASAIAAAALPTGLVVSDPAPVFAVHRLFKLQIAGEDYAGLLMGNFSAGYASWKWTHSDGSQVQLFAVPL